MSKSDIQWNIRVPFDTKRDFEAVVPNRQRSRVLNQLIVQETERRTKRQTHQGPEKDLSTNFQTVGLIGYIPDYRLYDATDLIISSSKLYLHVSPFSLFYQMHNHQSALMKRFFDGDLETLIAISGETCKGEANMEEWHPHHESDRGICEDLKRHTILENNAFEFYGLRGHLGLPVFIIAGDDFAISSVKTDLFTETGSYLALVWAKPVDDTQESEYHWLIDNLGVRMAADGIRFSNK